MPACLPACLHVDMQKTNEWMGGSAAIALLTGSVACKPSTALFLIYRLFTTKLPQRTPAMLTPQHHNLYTTSPHLTSHFTSHFTSPSHILTTPPHHHTTGARCNPSPTMRQCGHATVNAAVGARLHASMNACMQWMDGWMDAWMDAWMLWPTFQRATKSAGPQCKEKQGIQYPRH
eukprot:366536-Chlamydomonas_euryale.AAC.13